MSPKNPKRPENPPLPSLALFSIFAMNLLPPPTIALTGSPALRNFLFAATIGGNNPELMSVIINKNAGLVLSLSRTDPSKLLLGADCRVVPIDGGFGCLYGTGHDGFGLGETRPNFLNGNSPSTNQ